MQDLIKIPEIVLQSALQNPVVSELLCNYVIDELRKIPNIQNFKLSNHITELICTLIENAKAPHHRKEDKIDKKAIAINILTQLFSLSVPEIHLVSDQIDYVCKNKIVKKIKRSKVKKVVNYVGGLFFLK